MRMGEGYENADNDCDSVCEGDPRRTCGGLDQVDMYSMHDCNNLLAVPCKHAARPVEHADMYTSRYYRKHQVPCKSAMLGPLTTSSSFCHVTCKDGYKLV